MSDESQRHLNDRAKHRLRIAARFMRQKGHRFDSGDFYGMVIAVIMNLGTVAHEKLRDLVSWVEKYETTELAIYGKPTRSRARKKQKKQIENALCAQASPDAKPKRLISSDDRRKDTTDE